MERFADVLPVRLVDPKTAADPIRLAVAAYLARFAGVQDYDGLVRPKDYPAVVAGCAKRLGAKANAFGSAAVAEDLKAVLETLHVKKADLYGDSYGSYAAQVFAVHYPRFVRDLVLDGTYDQQFNPFEPEAVTALRRAWNTICTSFPGCKGDHLPNDIGAFARKLARHPIVGVADDEYGKPQHIDLTAGAFAQLVLDATYSYTFFRDLPAALVAAGHRDITPLMRLAAEDVNLNAGAGGRVRRGQFAILHLPGPLRRRRVLPRPFRSPPGIRYPSRIAPLGPARRACPAQARRKPGTDRHAAARDDARRREPAASRVTGSPRAETSSAQLVPFQPPGSAHHGVPGRVARCSQPARAGPADAAPANGLPGPGHAAGPA